MELESKKEKCYDKKEVESRRARGAAKDSRMKFLTKCSAPRRVKMRSAGRVPADFTVV
jgi:hypothetical protein